MKRRADPLAGFVDPADAIVACRGCGAAEGVPCRGKGLKPGFVHFGRRVRRLLLTAKAPERRARLEAKALRMLRAHLRRERLGHAPA